MGVCTAQAPPAQPRVGAAMLHVPPTRARPMLSHPNSRYNRTSIIVAHRLSSVINFDAIAGAFCYSLFSMPVPQQLLAWRSWCQFLIAQSQLFNLHHRPITLTVRPQPSAPTLSLAVLRAGEIVESGNHDELMAAGGEYSRLASLQITHGQGRDLIRVEADEVSEAEVGTWVGDATVDARLNAPARLSPPSAHHAHRRRRSLHLPSSWPAKPCGRPCWGACTGPQQLCSRCKGVEGRALKAVFVGPTGSSQHPTGQPSTPYHCPDLSLRTVPSAACCVSSAATGRPCSSRC